jgi:nucleoside-diphosphate-sugar epimerase
MDVPLTEAIIRGAREGKAVNGVNTLLYHLSGAGNFVDNSETGNYVPTDHRFDDANPADVRKISAAYQPNGACDELIFQAAAAGILNAYFVCPAAIYGNSANHIGLTASSSSGMAPGVWIDYMIKNIETLGFGAYVGEGTSVFGVVHVDDVVSLMMLVLEKALNTQGEYQPQDVYKHFYIGVDKEEQSKALQTALADVVYRRGKIPSPVVKSVPYAEAGFVARYASYQYKQISEVLTVT